MKLRPVIAACGLVLALWTQPACASPFQDGLKAYNQSDYATALRIWLPLAEQGNALAQFSLGKLYYSGQGVPQDFAVAAEWYLRAALQGVAEAQYVLGAMHDKGHGVKKDPAMAAILYLLAAEQGIVEAQNDLAHV